MYGEFSGASSVKCLENALNACQFMLCMYYESEIKIYYIIIINGRNGSNCCLTWLAT